MHIRPIRSPAGCLSNTLQPTGTSVRSESREEHFGTSEPTGTSRAHWQAAHWQAAVGPSWHARAHSPQSSERRRRQTPPPPMRLGAPSPTASFGRTLTSGASAAKEAVVGLCQRGRGLACQEGLAPPLWPHFDLNEPHRLFRHTLTSKAPGRGKRGGGPAPTGAASQATQAPRSSASLRRLTQAPSLGGAALPPKPQSLGWVKRRPPSLRLSAADSTWAQSPLSPLSGAVG